MANPEGLLSCFWFCLQVRKARKLKEKRAAKMSSNKGGAEKGRKGRPGKKYK